MKRTLAAILVSLVLFTPLALAKDGKSITVSSNGIVEVSPDSAQVRLGVDVSRKTAEMANADNASMMTKVIAAMGELGIKKEDIQTSGYNIWPEYKYEQNMPAKLTGYRCSNQVVVNIYNDLGKVSKVIDYGVNSGVNTVSGISFFRKDDLEFRKQALQKAVGEAQAKADLIAKAAGIKAISIKEITESGVSVSPVNYDMRAMSMMKSAPETPVSPGTMQVSGSVTIIYEID